MSPRSRREWVFVGSCVLIGALLRLPSLHAGLWRDEASTYFDIVHAFPQGIIGVVQRSELSPPGFYLLMAAWCGIFGTGEQALKLPAFIFGLALIPASYALGRACAPGVATGCVAAAIAATAPAAVFFSQDARSYSLAALLCSLCAFAYVRLPESRRRSDWIAFVLFAVGSIYVQFTGLVFMAALGVATLYSCCIRRSFDSLAGYAVAFGTIALFALPLVPSIAAALHVGNPWLPASGHTLHGFLLRLVENLQAAIPLDLPSWRGKLQATAFCAVAGAAVLDFCVAHRRNPDVAQSLRCPVAALLVAYVCGATIEAVQGVRVMFAFEPLGWLCLAFWSVSIVERAAAAMGAATARKLLAPLAAVTAIVFAGFEIGSALRLGAVSSASGIRPFLARGPEADTVYVVAPDFMAPTFGYYARGARGIDYHGFARWDHPEYVDLLHIESDWNSPTLVRDTEARIACLHGVRWLTVVVASDAWGRLDTAHLSLSAIDRLLNDLGHRYQLVKTRTFPGREESVIVYRYAFAGNVMLRGPASRELRRSIRIRTSASSCSTSAPSTSRSRTFAASCATRATRVRSWTKASTSCTRIHLSSTTAPGRSAPNGT